MEKDRAGQQKPDLYQNCVRCRTAVSALSSHSASHTDYFALCTVLSCAPTAPALPPGNPALSFYIPRSDCGLYYCSPLSAPTGIPNLSDFALLYPFRKVLFLLRFITQPYHNFLFHVCHILSFLSAHFKSTFRVFNCPFCLFVSA